MYGQPPSVSFIKAAVRHNEVPMRKDIESLRLRMGLRTFLFLGQTCLSRTTPSFWISDNQKIKRRTKCHLTKNQPRGRHLGLGGLTMNAMALIAPGAFLWLTFFIQSSYGAPMAAQGMWFGIFAALLLCLATAIAYAELSKLYPGAGSSYFFAEQAFLSKTKAYKFARVAKFMVGWASHLYYWAYPGLMVGVTALVVGYMVGQIWPDTFNAAIPSPLFMIIFCPLFAFGVAYICFRGVTGTTAVNTAINVIQITALVVFSVIAVGYRLNHPQGSVGITLDPNGSPITKVIATDKDGKPVKDAQGNFVIAKGPDGKEQDFIVDYSMPLQKGPFA